jgi:hypothetical protein
MLKKFLAGLSALALSLGMIALVAGPASAHTGDLHAAAACQADGTYKVTYTLTVANTALAGTTVWSIGTTSFAHTPTSNADLPGTVQPGTVASTGAGDYVLGTITLPGSSIQAPWAYAYTTWTDNFVKGSDGGDITLDGTCGDTPDSKTITFCHYDGSNDNGGSGNYSELTTSLWAFYQAGHINHSNDIFPAGSVVHQGVTYSWSAQGDQNLLQYPDCAIPKDATASIAIAEPGCDTNSVASVVGVNFVPVTLDQTVGPHDVTVYAASGHTFADGTTSVVLHYEIVAGPVSQSTDPNGQCFVVPPPVACVALAGWQTEDLAPTLTPAGLSFDGPHTQAVDTYQRVTAGNMQGLTGMTYTVSGVSGYTARVVVEVNPNADLGSGVIHYATISTTTEAVNGVNAVQGGLWYTSKIAYSSPGGQGNPISWAAMTALMPTNELLSAPSLHLQTNSTAGSHSIVSSISSSCGETNFVPVAVTPVDPTVVDQSCVVDDSGAGSYVSGYIDLPTTTGVSYFIDGSPAGTHNEVAPGTYQVTATAAPGYILTGYPEGGWPLTVASALPCGDLITHPDVVPIVTFTQLTCTRGGSYTLSNDLGDDNAVIWTVDGSPVAPGTYQVTSGRTVTVHAEPNGPDYGFDAETQRDWSFTFAAATGCDLTTLALTGSTPVGGMLLGYFLLIAGIGIVAVRAVRRRPVRGPQE